MKNLILVVSFLFWAPGAMAQSGDLGGNDTTRLSKLETVQRARQSVIDSLNSKLAIGKLHTPDTLAHFQYKLDSIQQSTNAAIDSVNKILSSSLKDIEHLSQKLERRIDSLASRKLRTDKYTELIDSLRVKVNNLQSIADKKIESIQTKAAEKINGLNVPPELRSQFDKLKSNIGHLTTENSHLPNINKITKLPSTNLPSKDLMSLPNNLGQLNELNVSDGKLPTHQDISAPIDSDKIGGLGKTPNELAGAQEAVSKLKDIKSQSIDDLADSQAGRLNGVKQVQEQSQIAELSSITNEQALKNEMKNQVRRAAIDHFAGKQKQLTAAMEQLNKLKSKYPLATSIKDSMKRAPNPMKGKRFVQRLVPGVSLQILKKSNDFFVDFNPYIGYRFTGRLTSGIGWNHRVGYNWDERSFNHNSQIYGPRIFSDFQLKKGFAPRVEIEMMNTMVPPATITAADPNERQWVFGLFAGIKKEYRIAGRLKGTATVMFNLYNPKHQSPYAHVINARVGFELPIRASKRSRPSQELKAERIR